MGKRMKGYRFQIPSALIGQPPHKCTGYREFIDSGFITHRIKTCFSSIKTDAGQTGNRGVSYRVGTVRLFNSVLPFPATDKQQQQGDNRQSYLLFAYHVKRYGRQLPASRTFTVYVQRVKGFFINIEL